MRRQKADVSILYAVFKGDKSENNSTSEKMKREKQKLPRRRDELFQASVQPFNGTSSVLCFCLNSPVDRLPPDSRPKVHPGTSDFTFLSAALPASPLLLQRESIAKALFALNSTAQNSGENTRNARNDEKKLFFLCNPTCICQRWQLSYTGIQKTKGQNHGSA